MNFCEMDDPNQTMDLKNTNYPFINTFHSNLRKFIDSE